MPMRAIMMFDHFRWREYETEQETEGDNLCRCIYVCYYEEKKLCGMLYLIMNGVDIIDDSAIEKTRGKE